MAERSNLRGRLLAGSRLLPAITALRGRIPPTTAALRDRLPASSSHLGVVVTAVRGRFLASPRLGTGVVVVCVASLIATGGGYLLERSGEAAPTASTQPVAKAPNPNGSPSPRLPAVSLPKPPKPGQRLPAVGNRTGKPVPPPLPPAPPVQPGSGPRSFTGSSAVALTFDDGPHPTYTPQILDLLRSYGIRATFCVVGTQVRQHPALVARMVREGHSLCNHSWHHDTSLGSRTAAEIRSDLTRTNAEIQRAAPGARIRYFRQPGGRWTPLVIQVAADLGMISIDWDIDPRDWDRPPAQQIADYVIRYTRRGSIVLMHDGGGDRSTTVAACRMILPNLKSRFTLIALR